MVMPMVCQKVMQYLSLILEQLLDHLIYGQGVEVLDDLVENKPVSDLLPESQSLRVEDRLDIGFLRRFSAL